MIFDIKTSIFSHVPQYNGHKFLLIGFSFSFYFFLILSFLFSRFQDLPRNFQFYLLVINKIEINRNYNND